MSVVTGTAERHAGQCRGSARMSFVTREPGFLVLNLHGSAEDGKKDLTSDKQRDRGVNIV